MFQDGPTIAEYMAEFPSLRKPAGYTLVSMGNILNIFVSFIIKIKHSFRFRRTLIWLILDLVIGCIKVYLCAKTKFSNWQQKKLINLRTFQSINF